MAVTVKSEQTRRLLIDTALHLFTRQGYEKTTMRTIALEAGVSVGNAYYYFRSKDDLIHELYRSLQDEHRSLALPLIREGQNLGENLAVILGTWLTTLEPYHAFGAHFLRDAMAPNRQADAAVGRGKSIALFRQAVTSARPQPPLAIRDDLPELLWLVHMGISLFWVYDHSPGQRRSHRLAANLAPLIAKLVILSRLPVVRNIVEDVVSLLRGIRRDP
ncbi:TetR/AcrR family transcriptional regulator [Arthrobacter zhangbolii]|uniref:TetR/AcrR family transcriptional regulator n=1 Tax=Arthrobacter zhangbolii TaxID=2886936 RepID=A0A9X1MA76_9MICC|nr:MULTISPECIES: TetR family transcriptional regulator [Arthrobacter]MCC3273600.1 TetR/AcrR family transcriptional regulator [Arthrobacter zhangbolii]MCC3295665.1 TetR/AcrR family transcriptional regulator [Arthrobacter zhangbolii]MDN3905881.1 TetR family transcriptional regulator [Arthrobacter sp. YD2]UON92408.1 TetR/AcrR family transcriptional regulator [Arthrobacter zhangbolii]